VLLLGSLLPELVSAVIGYVPGAVVHSAQNACDPAHGPDSREGPAWLFRGHALPHLWQGNRTATWAPWDSGPEPRRHADALLTALQDADAVERARIRVENIRGPVLLLSASDDGSWPSSLYGRMVSERLATWRHPHPVEHLDSRAPVIPSSSRSFPPHSWCMPTRCRAASAPPEVRRLPTPELTKPPGRACCAS